MSSAVTVQRHAFFTRQEKRLAKKLARFVSSEPISTIQVPFCRARTALQLHAGMKFFCRAVPMLRDAEC